MSSSSQKVGADVIQSILGTIEALDPGAADVLAIVEGALEIVPEAIDLVEGLIAEIKGTKVAPLEPQVESDTQAAADALTQPLPTPGS